MLAELTHWGNPADRGYTVMQIPSAISKPTRGKISTDLFVIMTFNSLKIIGLFIEISYYKIIASNLHIDKRKPICCGWLKEKFSLKEWRRED